MLLCRNLAVPELYELALLTERDSRLSSSGALMADSYKKKGAEWGPYSFACVAGWRGHAHGGLLQEEVCKVWCVEACLCA
eukprot:349583-Chlamydomonas_euryale.AAC.3